MYKIILEKKVQKFLKKHQWEKIISIFWEKLHQLSQNPYDKNLSIKPLLGQGNQYRLRIWQYRFLYEVNDSEIIITLFDAWTRWDIYKSL